MLRSIFYTAFHRSCLYYRANTGPSSPTWLSKGDAVLELRDTTDTSTTAFNPILLRSDCLDDSTAIAGRRAGPGFDVDFRKLELDLPEQASKPVRIGLIDCYRFSQECLVKAFTDMQPGFAMFPFTTIQDCILAAAQEFDLVVYYTHAGEMETMQNIGSIRQAFETIPLIVLSDAEDAHLPKAIYGTLKQGAHGFIPTRSMGIPMIVAAIQFVKAGGTFAPLDLLLPSRTDPVREAPAAAPQNKLTSRQVMVLGHLQQGKANKIIAHELGMSESTVKVHVRNIMRKMGTRNRTQAAVIASRPRIGQSFDLN